MRKVAEENGWPINRFYNALLQIALSGSGGPEMAPLFDELVAKNAVSVKLNYLGK